METEGGVGGLTYRFVYGLEKVETVIYGIPNGAGSVMQQYEYPNSTENIVKLYYHQDRLGSTDFLTDNVAGKVTSYVTYDDWGMLTAKAVLKVGVRELDLVQEYTGHAWDMVLGVYFAQARMYDAGDRRFVAADPVKGYIVNPQSLNSYAYAINNALKYVDPLGLETTISPIEVLSGLRGFWDVDNIKYKGQTYYHVVGLMEVLGGSATYDKKSNSTTLSLTYSGITVNVVYCMDDVPRAGFLNRPINDSMIYGTGQYTKNGEVFDAGFLPILYNNQKTYVSRLDLLEYFKKIFCEDNLMQTTPEIIPVVENKHLSFEGQKTLMALEVVNTYADALGLLKVEDGNLIGIMPHNVGDGSITVGFGDYLQSSDYKYYKDNYAIEKATLESKMLPIKTALAKFSFDVADCEKRLNDFCKNNNIALYQHQFDALVFVQYNAYNLGEKITDYMKAGIRNGVNSILRQDWWDAFYEKHGGKDGSGKFDSAWGKRTNIEIRIFYGEGYSISPEFEAFEVNIPEFGRITK